MKNSYLLFVVFIFSGFFAFLLKVEKSELSPLKVPALPSATHAPESESKPSSEEMKRSRSHENRVDSLLGATSFATSDVSRVHQLEFPESKKIRIELMKDAHSTPQSFRNFASQIAPLMEVSLSEILEKPQQVSPLLKALTQRLSDCAEGDNSVEYPVRALCWYNLKRIAHASANPQLRRQIVKLESQLPLRVRHLASRI